MRKATVVGIKLQPWGARPARQVLNDHQAKGKENGGEVMFSTNIMISPRQANIREVVFYFEKEPEMYLFVQADVLNIFRGDKSSFIPKGAYQLSPEEYIEPMRTWLHIKNLRRADPIYIRDLYVVHSDGSVHPSEPFTSAVFDSPRINRVYLAHGCDDYDDTDGDDGLNF